jgi:hypothetical protein
VKLTDIEQARSMVNGPGGSPATGPTDSTDASTGTQLRRALFEEIVGSSTPTPELAEAVNRRFFPLQVIVYTGEDIEIKKGEVLTIEPEGHEPVVVNYGSVTLEQGGLIRCKAPVLFIVQRFIKKK